ncbi:HAD family hydrolase [Streptomyces boninensis]|uniref:HAD family hydrolase n=1 Tax=Streptomyces boninensis TaxID=2039455 RepID=UPI003B227B4F
MRKVTVVYDAVLCDIDTTAGVAFSPEVDLPLLRGEITKVQWTESIAAGLAEHVAPAQARELALALTQAPFNADEAVVALLREVRGRLPLVLVSNASVELEDELAVIGLADLADHVVNSARVGVAKPDARIYEIAATAAGAAIDRCLFVDDRMENIDAAEALGMTGVHYREPADLHEPLSFLRG